MPLGNPCWPHKSHKSHKSRDHMIAEQTQFIKDGCAGSRLNELCINGPDAAATTTGWLLALITPRSSTNKPNQVVVGDGDTHSLLLARTHAHTHARSVSLCVIRQCVCVCVRPPKTSYLPTNSNCFLALLTSVQPVWGHTLKDEGTNSSRCVGPQHTRVAQTRGTLQNK